MEKKVGIVVPSYNQGKYIEETLKSIIVNKRHIDIDIVVMDGGSEDETLSIIRKYEGELKSWRSEKDKGQANAINKGIAELPDCDYYLWLNSDDVYESEFAIKDIVEYAEVNQYEVCYGLSHFIDENGEVVGVYPVKEFSYKRLGVQCYLSQPSVMFSKKAYEETGPLNERLIMCLDYEYWIRLAQRYEFGFVRKYIGATRMYGGTKTSTMQQRHLSEAMEILNKYYRKIPMHWIVTKYLADRPESIIRYVPKRLLRVLLYPFRKRIVRKSLEKEIYV